jgi:transcriptional regulator with GAF, ATPase, and Fis domain
LGLGERSTLPQLDPSRASRIFASGSTAWVVPSANPVLQPRDEARESSFDLAERFYRLLSVQREMLGETQLERLVPAALAVALELSGAERGFILLREGEGFRVAFSRDVDGNPIARQHLDISESIARQAAQSGETIVTTDASADARFGQAVSVHRLQLTAILCVPIRGRGLGTLGCVYLDHRHAGRAFLGHAPKMLGAFADQIALALQTARLVEDLRRERDELARAQTQVRELLGEKEALLAEKEERLLDLDGRCERLQEELARERGASGLRHDYSHLIAQAPSMRRVLAQLDRVVDATLPIVVQGESGTGKELIARALHFQGPRQKRPFVAVNCGALSESLLESELFGHKRGAFTGATEDRKGLFEAAQGGTLFLDEVGEMSLAMQVKLLRALQERRVRPVGAVQEIAVDARVVAATNRDLARMVAEGSFREDLYYRLATLVLHLPPLRERREDVPLLVRHLLERACQEAQRPVPRVTADAVHLLLDYDWPGNIRQLENVIRAAVVLSDGDLEPAILAPLLGARPERQAGPPDQDRPRRRQARPGGRPARPRQGRRALGDLAAHPHAPPQGVAGEGGLEERRVYSRPPAVLALC